ncbi:MAG TPA: suppressor of fused domain protein, partial [Thermoanaerobaculaceae bacterium]|nr:suppressor of fused domain protein [Thermoanaerobaculaceae bacterium]
LRRFAVKVHFDYLKPEQRLRLFEETWQRCAQANGTVPLAIRRRLDQLEHLTPGDFAAVVRQLKILARLPHKFQSWLWWGHTVPHGDPPEPFAATTELCCSMLISPVSLPDELDTLWLEDGREVTFFSLFPLYREEMEYKLAHGAEALLERVVQAGLDDVVDPRRPNVCLQA